ncbi:uncharacterized protein LOC123410935 [Hordeum vulgare subsp. vulgare]|uniref:uncharacterized protein LOC123410935 n=1 Tax=Hordeum vulgare subsp. vulgare TaxID=112509 RepID=UPI000296E9F0|nr:uncharacterized protein LOC123410935 [Hordeum vulgare subsp. vulgare]
MQHGRTPVQFDPEVGSGAGDSDEGPSPTPSSARSTVWTPSDSPHELADQDNHRVGDEDFREHLAVLSSRPRPITVVGPRMDWEQQRKVDERLALYRIRASKMAQGVSMDELDDMTLRKEYPPEALEEAYYFSDYGREGTIDWHFDPDLSVHSYLSDYHRLVLKNGDGTRYLEWDKYCSWFTTYETDEEYLKYFEEISKKIKWIKRYMIFERESPEWIEMEARAYRQAVEIAVDFPHISSDLAFTAYTDHIFNMRSDYFDREEIDPLLFDIWKRVTKQKITFRQALDQIRQENMFPRHEKCIQFVLDYSSTYTRLQLTFDTCVEDIPDETPEDEGRRLITMAVWTKLHKEKTWSEYIMRKIEIAKHIGLDLQATCIPI